MRSRLLVLASVLLLAACGSKREEPSPTAPLAAATLPTSSLALLAVDDAKSNLESLRGQFRDRAGALPIPADASEVLAGLAPIPEPILARVDPSTPLRTLYLADGNGTRRVIAVKMRTDANPTMPLGVGITVLEGGPDGSRWVGARPSGSDVALALFDKTLVVGENQQVLTQAGRYLATVAIESPVGPGFALKVFGTAFDGALRTTLDGLIEEMSTSALESARAEKAQHTEASPFGDPERIVELMRDRARHYLAYFPDVSGLELRVVASPNGVSVDGIAEVDRGSPLARALASVDVGAPFGFDRLPVGTSFAIATARARGDASIVERIRPIAGARLSSEDALAFESAAESLGTMRGAPSVLALGGHADGPFLAFASAAGDAPLEARALEAAFGIPYVKGLIGALVGCDQISRLSLERGNASLCRNRTGPTPTLEFARGQSSNAVVIAARSSDQSTPHAAGTVLASSSPAASGLFSSPDASRALLGMTDKTFLTIALSPRGLVPSLGLVGSNGLRSLAASRALPSSAAPLVFALGRNEAGSITVRGAATPRSLEEAHALATLAKLFASGG